MPYASGTVVSVDKSRLEIEKLLTKAGAQMFSHSWASTDKALTAIIQFQIKETFIRFKLPIPSVKSGYYAINGKRRRPPGEQANAYEAECRRRWRALFLCIKAKLEAVESGIALFEEEFLAQIVDPVTKTTVGEHFVRLLQENRPLGLPHYGGENDGTAD